MSIMVVVFVVLIFYLWRRQNQKLPLRRLLGGVSVSECSEADVHIDGKIAFRYVLIYHRGFVSSDY